MRGGFLAAVSAAILAAAVFIGVSQATSAPGSDSVDFPPNLPVSALPVVALSAEQQTQFNNLLTADTSAQFGITSDSYAHARLLTTTSAGPLYAIPGTNGQCLVLWPAASCGDIGLGEASVALYIPNPAGDYLVGGGILASSSASASVVGNDGSRTGATPIPGGFTISESQAVVPGPNVTTEVD